MNKNALIAFLLLFLFSCNSQKKTNSTSNVDVKIGKVKKLPPIEFENKTPKNIILMIGDGMGVSQIYAAMVRNDNYLNLERMRHIGFHKCNPAKGFITDSAAGATAFSTGKKTYNGAIGVDVDSIPQTTILETAMQQGLSTGLVATSTIVHATPASFVAHQYGRHLYENIALDIAKTDVNVLIAGGESYFTERKDKINLLEKMQKRGYEVFKTKMDYANFQGEKMIAFMAKNDPKRVKRGRGNALEKASLKAIEILNKNEKGFFLMIEGSQIDWGGHSNDSEYIISETIDFDKTLGKVLEFADQDQNTLVIVTADHETGGYAINGGNLETGEIEGAFTSDGHTAVMIPVFAYGPGAEKFMGIYENTDIYFKMKDLYGF